MVKQELWKDGGGTEREFQEHLSMALQPPHYPGLQTATDLPRSEQAGTSQYSHFTFALFNLKKHQGFLSPSGFLKLKKKTK